MFKVFGVNPAEQGGVDPLGEAKDEKEVKKIMGSALNQYESFRINDPSGSCIDISKEDACLMAP
jgi:hypothetical protein